MPFDSIDKAPEERERGITIATAHVEYADGEASLRARGLSGSRGLREEHDHGCGADGRRDPGGGGDRRSDAADAGAHPAGASGGRAVHRGVHEQGGHGGRSGAAGPGGAGGSGAAVEVRVPRGRHSGDSRQRAEGAERTEPGPRGREVHLGADGGGGHVHSDAGARDGQAVPDAGGGRVLDHGSRDGGDGSSRARHGEGGRQGGARRDPGDAQERGDGCGDVPQDSGRGAGGRQRWFAASRDGQGRAGARDGVWRSRGRSRRTRSSRARCTS